MTTSVGRAPKITQAMQVQGERREKAAQYAACALCNAEQYAAYNALGEGRCASDTCEDAMTCNAGVVNKSAGLDSTFATSNKHHLYTSMVCALPACQRRFWSDGLPQIPQLFRRRDGV